MTAAFTGLVRQPVPTNTANLRWNMIAGIVHGYPNARNVTKTIAEVYRDDSSSIHKKHRISLDRKTLRTIEMMSSTTGYMSVKLRRCSRPVTYGATDFLAVSIRLHMTGWTGIVLERIPIETPQDECRAAGGARRIAIAEDAALA
jgi:hypothetical protein